MNALEFADLRRRVAEFELDDPAAGYPFSARLARENGWSRAFALRVVEEYKRFVLLCQIAPRPPCPSEQVDEAWHLHLTYTRSYWQELCGRVLQRPLHHEPTKGGADEHAKHVELYQQTLQLYRETFGAEPPVDIWPAAEIRFGVDTKPWWLLRRWRSKFTTASCVALPLVAMAWNPLDWRGPEFLGLYAVVLFVALFIALVLRNQCRPATEARLEPPLSPLELAQLARGHRGAITATLAKLVSEGALQLQEVPKEWCGMNWPSEHRLVGGIVAAKTPLEQALVKAIVANPQAKLPELTAAAGDALERTEAQLVNRGLVYDPRDVWLARFVPASVMMLVLLLGVVKLCLGLARERPVGFLAVGCVITLIAVIYLARNIRRSPAGDSLIADLQSQHAEWQSPGKQSRGLSPAQIATAVALFGTTALAGSAYANMNLWEQQAWGGDHSSSSGSGCSSGCGGGGCGGGGCGGCGGD